MSRVESTEFPRDGNKKNKTAIETMETIITTGEDDLDEGSMIWMKVWNDLDEDFRGMEGSRC